MRHYVYLATERGRQLTTARANQTPGLTNDRAAKLIACENIRFSSLFAAGDVSRGGTFATQRQKFHTDDANQC